MYLNSRKPFFCKSVIQTDCSYNPPNKAPMLAGTWVLLNRPLSASMHNANHGAFITNLSSYNTYLNYDDPHLFCLFSRCCRGHVFTALWTQSVLPSPGLNVTRIEILHTRGLRSNGLCVYIKRIEGPKEGLSVSGGISMLLSAGKGQLSRDTTEQNGSNFPQL